MQEQVAYWYEDEPERVPSVQERDWEIDAQVEPEGAEVWE